MATITTTGSGNWSSTTPDAPWPSGTKPTTGDVVEIAAGHTVTLDEDTAVLGAAGIKNVTGSNTSVLDVSGTRTINGCVSYSGTATTGFITAGTGDALTINYGGGAGTSAVTNSSTGFCVAVSGSGVLTVTNSGGTASTCSGSGRGIDHASTGNLTITGALVASGGRACYIRAACVANITGDLSASAAASLALHIVNGTVTIDGNLSTSNGDANAVFVGSSSVVNWYGSRTLAASAECHIVLGGGTLNLVRQDAPYTTLALANSGTFVLRQSAGTLNTTGNGGAAVASIVNQTATSYAVILGGTDAQKAIITGPTLPAAGDVDDTAADFGYAASLITPTFAVPAEADVESGVQYGAGGTEFTGTLEFPSAAAIAAAMWADETSPDRTLTE